MCIFFILIYLFLCANTGPVTSLTPPFCVYVASKYWQPFLFSLLASEQLVQCKDIVLSSIPLYTIFCLSLISYLQNCSLSLQFSALWQQKEASNLRGATHRKTAGAAGMRRFVSSLTAMCEVKINAYADSCCQCQSYVYLVSCNDWGGKNIQLVATSDTRYPKVSPYRVLTDYSGISASSMPRILHFPSW